VFFSADDQQKQIRCQKIQENKMRRDVRSGSSSSSSSCGPLVPADSIDSATVSPESQSTSTSTSPGQPEYLKHKPGAQTHVIASSIEPSMLQGLPCWCTELLEEVSLLWNIACINLTINLYPITYSKPYCFQWLACQSVLSFQSSLSVLSALQTFFM